jgi:hypothetical protein
VNRLDKQLEDVIQYCIAGTPEKKYVQGKYPYIDQMVEARIKLNQIMPPEPLILDPKELQ